jgi:hypothetical protein
MDLSIIPECNIDTKLIESLVPPVTRYNHQKGCGTVAKTMNGPFAERMISVSLWILIFSGKFPKQ